MRQISLNPHISTNSSRRSVSPSCPQLLPSAQTAMAFREGKPGAWLAATRDTIERAGLIGLGLYLAGEREALLKKSFVSSAVIEASIILLGLEDR